MSKAALLPHNCIRKFFKIVQVIPLNISFSPSLSRFSRKCSLLQFLLPAEFLATVKP